MATMYQLNSEYLKLYTELTEREFDEKLIGDTIESTGLTDAIHDKAENYAIVLNQLEADTFAIDAEIRRLNDRKQMFKANAAKLKANLFNQLRTVNETKFKTKLFSFSTRKSQSVAVIEVDELPSAFIRVETKKSADKTAIKNAIKAGQVVKGAELINNESLVIK